MSSNLSHGVSLRTLLKSILPQHDHVSLYGRTLMLLVLHTNQKLV